MSRDDHVAGSVGGECQPVNLFAVGTTEERRPLEPGINHQRQRGSAVRNLESISLAVDLAEATLETTCGSVGKFFPGHRCGLAKGPGASVENERPIGGNLECLHADRADDYL